MKDFTEDQIKKALSHIEQMSHYEMCRLWRFSPIGDGEAGSIYFRSDLPTGEAFKKRLFEHFGGFTPEISKSIGWKNDKRTDNIRN